MKLKSFIDNWLQPNEKLNGLALIDHLFNRFDGMYGQKWRSTFLNEKSIENWRLAWADDLRHEKINLDEIAIGLKTCRLKYIWPPSISEFIIACRPLPDFANSFSEAVEQLRRREWGGDKWSHPAIYFAAKKIGEFEMRTTSWSAIRGRWESALNAEMRKSSWPLIPTRKEEPKALPASGRCFTSPEEAQRQIFALRQILRTTSC